MLVEPYNSIVHKYVKRPKKPENSPSRSEPDKNTGHSVINYLRGEGGVMRLSDKDTQNTGRNPKTAPHTPRS